MKLTHLGLFTALCLFSKMSVAQTLDTQYDEQQVDIQSKTKNDSLELAEEAPDTFALWYHIQQKDKALAQQEFTRLTRRYTNWQPDKDLLDAMARVTSPEVHKLEPQAVVKQQPSSKKKATSVFARMSRGGEVYWRSMPIELLQQASERAFKEKDLAHHALLGWAFISRALYHQSLRHFTYLRDHQEGEKSTIDGIRQAILGMVSQAASEGNEQALEDLIVEYPEQPIIEHIEFHAWQHFQKKQFEQALGLFRFTSNYFSQVLSLKELGRLDEAVAVACQHVGVANLLNYCVNAYAEKQLSLFKKESYQASLDMADKIRMLQPLNSDQLEICAWSHFHLGHIQQSVRAFSDLIQQQPDNQNYARILVILLKDDRNMLNAMANTYPAIAHELNRQNKTLAWNRKQFNRFYRLNDTQEQDNQFLLEAGLHWRSQGANDPLANLDSQHYFVGLARDWLDYRFGVRLNYQKTDSRSPNVGDAFGMGLLDSPYDGLTGTNEKGLSAYLKKQSASANLLGEMSYWRPQNSLRPVFLGKLSGVWFLDNTTLAMALFRERVKDSVLSLHGLFAEETTRWGSVTANGIKGLVAYGLSRQWTVSAEFAGARLIGENVRANDKLNVSLSLTRNIVDLYPEKLDYLRIGPYLSWSHYQTNQNTFTVGNGGYFSPDLLVGVGGRAELLTLENKTWQLKGKLDLGYILSKPKEITRFPNRDDEQQGFQQSESGLGVGLELEGQWLFHPHWELIGRIKHNYSDTYRELNIGLHIRWNFSERRGITSDGFISSSPYQADYPWY
ncbi:hypothetical protein FX988_02700 [Paraglaciecola mesophila]|uniref:Cellulose synthase operon C C-terminal domain-containing protein n=1 Tax=Paraglaciecola mesophila TaxID=197222 RepID=A0A857JKM0_9ALTE|nr:cellulose synthase subunit BcsC-related outer membrane protein [Paraglaciecola mesophila]QHJ12443.1 hypothetical protein FX988_02700 [Paraglaciecola mesophila]